MEQVAGIGPATNAWEALVLPLNYTYKTSRHEESVERDRLFVTLGLYAESYVRPTNFQTRTDSRYA